MGLFKPYFVILFVNLTFNSSAISPALLKPLLTSVDLRYPDAEQETAGFRVFAGRFCLCSDLPISPYVLFFPFKISMFILYITF